MPMDFDDKLKLQLGSLEQDTLVELYQIDLTGLTARNGQSGSILYLHNGMNELRKNVVWRGQEYQAYPIKGSEFENSSEGASNRPSLTVSNLFGLVTAIVNDFDDCLGAKVKRIQVYAQYLDAVNFKSGKNAKYDPNMGIETNYLIEQVSSQTHEGASFTLVTPAEFDNLLLPARTVMANTCSWVYRSSECGYTGGAVADEKDRPVSDLSKDKCSKCLTGCKMRNNQRNYGGFIAVRNL